MIHKTIWLPVLTLAFCAVNTMQAITYPTKIALKKADHITSLAITATIGSLAIAKKYDCFRWAQGSWRAFVGAVFANIVINGMALKHERSVATLLKFLLPTSILGGLTVFENVKNKDNEVLKDVAFCTMIGGMIGNGVKNVWDVYSLVNHNQSESTQHDA